MPRGTKGPDIRDVKPTRVVMHLQIRIDGGTIGTSNELSAVVIATTEAFEKAAHDVGLGYGWDCELSCVQPKAMDAKVAKAGLHIEYPRLKGKSA